MSFDFSKVKAKVRQVVHKTLAVPATYQDSSINIPIAINARWLNKLSRIGDYENSGYAETVEGVDRIVFSAAEAQSIPVKKGGIVVFTSYANSDEAIAPVFILAVREPSNGPFEEVWEVTRK